MASIVKESGKYRAYVYVSGARKTRLFRTKREAEIWGASAETALRASGNDIGGNKYTVADALNRYAEEISPLKRGGRTKVIRLAAMKKQPAFPLNARLSEVKPDTIYAVLPKQAAECRPCKK